MLESQFILCTITVPYSLLCVKTETSFFFALLIPASLPTAWRVLTKLLILPLVVGVGFEFIMYAGKHENLFTKILSAPGLWMQRLTTKEPDDGMCEVAIAALTAVIPDDGSDCI